MNKEYKNNNNMAYFLLQSKTIFSASFLIQISLEYKYMSLVLQVVSKFLKLVFDIDREHYKPGNC